MTNPTEATTMEFERVCVCHQGSVCTEGCKRGLHHDGCPGERVERHVLLTPATCDFVHSDYRQCPVCDGGLAVCANCSKCEAKLDNPICNKQAASQRRSEPVHVPAEPPRRGVFRVPVGGVMRLVPTLEGYTCGTCIHGPSLDMSCADCATETATPPVESQPAPQKDEQLPPCAWCGKPPFVSATPDAVCCRNNRCPVESHGWMSMEAWLRRGAPATPSVEPLTHLALEQFRSTIHFLMSQVETLASRAFSEGQQEWLEHCDAYNAGRRAIQLADKIKQSMSTKENQP